MPSYQVDFNDSDDEPWRTDNTLKILQTSRVVCEEARAVLYKHSTIVFSCSAWVKSKKKYISPTRLSQTTFRSVEIRMDHDITSMTEPVEGCGRIFRRFCEMFTNQLAFLKTSRKELMTVRMRLDTEFRNHQVLDQFLEEQHDQLLTASLATLTDYRSVILEWHESCGCVTLCKPSKKCTRKPCAHVAKRIEVPISPLWEKLEEMLGPKTTEQMILWDKGNWLPTTRRFMRHRNCHVRRWIYRPLAFASGRGVDDSQMPDRVRYGYADCNHRFENLHKY